MGRGNKCLKRRAPIARILMLSLEASFFHLNFNFVETYFSYPQPCRHLLLSTLVYYKD